MAFELNLKDSCTTNGRRVRCVDVREIPRAQAKLAACKPHIAHPHRIMRARGGLLQEMRHIDEASCMHGMSDTLDARQRWVSVSCGELDDGLV